MPEVETAMADRDPLRLEDLDSPRAEVRYACVRRILSAAEKTPRSLLPHLTKWTGLLESGNRIFKWTAIEALGAVLATGAVRKAGVGVDRLIGFLGRGEMIAANHAVRALGKVARGIPAYEPRIVRALLKVEDRRYETPECRNIVLGKVLEAFGNLPGRIRWAKPLEAFAQRLTHNRRPATRRKAEKLLNGMRKSDLKAGKGPGPRLAVLERAR